MYGMYECMYVSMYLCMYVCPNVWIYVCIRIYVCMYICMYGYMYVYITDEFDTTDLDPKMLRSKVDAEVLLWKRFFINICESIKRT